MFLTAFLKPLIGFGVVGAVALTGGALTLFSKPKSTNAGLTGSVDKHSTEELSESVTPVVTEKPKYNFAVLQPGSSNNSIALTEGQQKIKCKLEGDQTTADFCALAKLPLNEPKKWIDLNKYNTYGFTSNIQTNYIVEEKTIYKVRVIPALAEAWERDQTKNLQIFKDGTEEDAKKPLITLSPKFVFKHNNSFKGKMQYVGGRVKGFDVASPNKYDVSNSWLTCALPGSPEVYKNCEMMLFEDDESSTAPTAWTQKNLKTPLTKAKEIKKQFHYLIRFNEKTAINDGRYAWNQVLKVKIYSDSARTSLVTSNIKEIHLQELSPIVLFEDHQGIDLALVL